MSNSTVLCAEIWSTLLRTYKVGVAQINTQATKSSFQTFWNQIFAFEMNQNWIFLLQGIHKWTLKKKVGTIVVHL